MKRNELYYVDSPLSPPRSLKLQSEDLQLQPSIELQERPESPSNSNSIMQKKTPSSPGTVLTVAGLFVVGLTLVLSGVIVLCQQSEKPFVICGTLFVAVGLVMLLACALLQRKNIVKFVQDLNQDLYFLNMSDSYMWKLMFVNHNELPEPHEDARFSQ